jgi:hypothetical protein
MSMALSTFIPRVSLASAFALLATAAFAAAPFEGHYRVAGHDAKLNFVLAKKGRPFVGNPVTLIVFSEKDGSNESDPETAARTGQLGDAIAANIMINKNNGDRWEVINMELSQAATPRLSKGSFGGSVYLNVDDVSLANGELSGHFTTKPGTTLMAEEFPLDVDLKFHVRQP